MTEQLEQRLSEVESKLRALESNSTIPYEVDRAFRERFRDIAGLTTSNKSASSENVAAVTSVNFGAETVGTTSVLGPPDVWLQVNLSGIPYYLPATTS